MKKITSIILAIIMAVSALAVGAVSASAADTAFQAGSLIFFDNTNTQWNEDEIYFYAWNYRYFGDFVPMKKVDFPVENPDLETTDNLFYVVVPESVPVGERYFLFTNSKDWSGKQTKNMPVEAGKNTYTPMVYSSGNVSSVSLSNTTYPKMREVVITPYSKEFTVSLDVIVYAFNLDEGEKATYSVDYEDETIPDITNQEFTGGRIIHLSNTATITVTAGYATETCTFTKVASAIINVTASYNSNRPYTGDLYVYTFGGDRVGAKFNKMSPVEGKIGQYEHTINGSAQVIFTTTDDWDTAVKFRIYDAETGDTLSEPLVSAGETVNYVLTVADPK